ncbi:hypothetical protein CRUP_027568 [Coryphaenoides rupestris]|nr:hypothetical protein CRUP_027568 [Coryphaenoides rupestris]
MCSTDLTGAPTAVAEAGESVAAAGAWPRRQGGGDVYMYVWIFLGLLTFLLTLLLVSLHRLKNLVSSSSSAADCSGGGGGGGGSSSSSSDRTSSFTNMEICSVSSQKSTVSTLSH